MSPASVRSVKSNHLGINISSSSVSAVGLDTRQNITFSQLIPGEVPFFSNDAVNVEALTAALKMVVEKSGTANVRAAVCFPERIAYSREHTLPKLKLSEIDEAIRWQIGTIFPLQAEDIYTDWKLLSQDATETKIVVVAVSRTLLDGLQNACVAAGIRPLSFEPSACTLARAQKDQTAPHIILEVDSFGSSASLIEQGVSSLTTTSVYAQAQTVDEIVTQINTSIQNLVYQRSETPPPIYLTGEKAVPKLVELLASASNLPVSMLSLPTENASFHVPYLAALSSVLPPESELSINLLPVNLREQYQLETNIADAKRTAKYGTAVGLIGLITVMGLYAASLIMHTTLAKEIANQQASQTQAVPATIPQTVKKAQLINQISPLKQFLPVEHIQLFQEADITNEHIRKLSFDAARKILQLTLADVSRENIYDLKNNLEKTGKFASISVPLTTFSTDSNKEATITLVLK